MTAQAASEGAALAPGTPVLAGIRVLDMTRLLPGNYATLLLYGLGAEVIKVEELGGDGTRSAPPYASTGESGPNVLLNRGKSSISLNLKDPDAVAAFLTLVGTADVLIDSFRPGVLDRLGLDEATLAHANRSLVHVSINAFGGDGPDAQLAAHDVNAQSLAGLLSLSSDDNGAPVMPGVQICDLASGMQAALAVLAGLRAVAQGAAGYRVEVAMSDVALGLTGLAAGHLAADAGTLPAARDALTGGLACYSAYRCADGRWLVSGGLEPKFFAATCAAIGAPELAALQYDLARQGELRGRLADIFATRTLADWMAVLRPADTCVTPVNDVAEAFVEPNAVERGIITEALLGDGRRVPVVRAVPWLAEGSAPVVAPELGADGERLLAESGVPADVVARLRDSGNVGGRS